MKICRRSSFSALALALTLVACVPQGEVAPAPAPSDAITLTVFNTGLDVARVYVAGQSAPHRIYQNDAKCISLPANAGVVSFEIARAGERTRKRFAPNGRRNWQLDISTTRLEVLPEPRPRSQAPPRCSHA